MKIRITVEFLLSKFVILHRFDNIILKQFIKAKDQLRQSSEYTLCKGHNNVKFCVKKRGKAKAGVR